jgi:ankyrin repeat protein
MRGRGALRPRGRGQAAASAPAAPTPALLALLGLPAHARPAAVRAALNKKDGHGNLPIHRALRVADPELVRAMLDAGGEAMLAVPNSLKALPLHCAANNSRFPAVVALLLARGPVGAARAENWGGYTPLGCAEVLNMSPAAEEIKALLRAAMQ